MESHHVPYRYNTYTDTLLAIGTAALAESLFGLDEGEILLRAHPDGFRIKYETRGDVQSTNPFFEVRDKAGREVKSANVRDRTIYGLKDAKPSWWGTTSVVNTLASPVFNNKLAQAYSPDLGLEVLEGTAKLDTGGTSQLLYAQASKGVNRPGPSTTQGNLRADAEQMLALLGYQQGAAGFLRDAYTISIVPRPQEISLGGYRRLTEGVLRGYLPRASSGKVLPTSDQTVPFFIAMMYFDFIVELFNYRQEQLDPSGGFFGGGVGNIISSLDRVMYVSMGTSSAPFLLDSLTVPTWLDRKAVVLNVRDLVRQTLGAHLDPNLLYLPVRAFAEGDPRPLVRFYRYYDPSGGKKRLLSHETLRYVMDQTGYADLNCDPMQRFARAIRSRTLTKLYSQSSEPPDFELLTRLRSAALAERRLINMLSAFVASYNLRNARLSANGKRPEGQNLSYEDLQVITGLIERYGAEFVANTLMAQAMSKRTDDPDVGGMDTEADSEAVA